jgi:hypothetical protein
MLVMNILLGCEGSEYWVLSNHTISFWHYIFNQNIKVLDYESSHLYVLGREGLINLMYLTFATTISPLNVGSLIHYVSPQAKVFSFIHLHCHCRCTQWNTPSDQLCYEDFQYKESVKLFVEQSTLIPLLVTRG